MANILAVPHHRQRQAADVEAEDDGEVEETVVEVIDGNRPSYSFYDHLMGNLQNKNRFVQLAMSPHGIAPPLDDPADYDEAPIPQAHYAFVNPALNGDRVPHWTETLERLKSNPVVSSEVKEQVIHALQRPIKIYGAGTESKFPLLIEYLVQRMQNYFSHYVYEDMSRPGSWELKVNDTATDSNPSSDKEPITESSKFDGPVKAAGPGEVGGDDIEEDIDYIIDFTLRPDHDDLPDVELKDEDFEKTTEEWEATKSSEEKNTTKNSSVKYGPGSEPTVIVERETLDLKVVEPIGLEDGSYLYVGDGTGEELKRSNKTKKKKKKLKRN